jgi:hypothetical protein
VRRARGMRISGTTGDMGISGCSTTLVLRILSRRGGDACLGRMTVGIGMRRGTEDFRGETEIRPGSRSSERIYCHYLVVFCADLDDFLSDLSYLCLHGDSVCKLQKCASEGLEVTLRWKLFRLL